jgi:hypothetical protein
MKIRNEAIDGGHGIVVNVAEHVADWSVEASRVSMS